MAQALQLYFGLPIVIGYLVSSIVIIPITFLGVTMISRLQLVTQPLWLIMLIAPFVAILYQKPDVLTEWAEFAGLRPGAGEFSALHFGAAVGVLFALVAQIGEQVDYLRFMPDKTRENRVGWWAAVVLAGPGWIIIGGLKMLAGSLLAVLAVQSGLGYADAVEPIHMYIEAYGYLSADPGTVLTAAMIFVLISQVKINVTNAYAGSLAWSNFYARVTQYHPGRVVWLVFNILISLMLMLMGVFETLETVLAVYANVAIAWIGAIFADLTVLKPLGISPASIEFKRAHLHNVNPVGCGAMAIASAVSIAAYGGAFGPLAAAYSTVLSLGIAVLAAIAIGIATQGRYYIARDDTLPARVKDAATVRCAICTYTYEARDMAYCPFYSGPICSLCCSLDAHCHDVCKNPAAVKELGTGDLGDGPFRRMILPDLAHRLIKVLGVALVMAVVTGAVFLLAYRLSAPEADFAHAGNARLLLRLYMASLVLIGIGAWWIVLSHESSELAERDLVNSLEQLTETRNELMRSEHLATIGQLTATVSHELRNPLGTLVSSLGVMRKYLHDDEDAKPQRELDLMERNIFRCVRIIEDLLEVSRNKEVRLQPVDLDRWIATQLEEFELPPQVGLRTDLQTGATALLDSDKFRQVLVNLLTNAEQAIALRDDRSPPRGTLAVATRLNGTRVELLIEDDGCGIAPGTDDRIYKPLYSTKAFGTGLGLPLVKEIVERHGGTVTVASEWGMGTTVTVALPLASRQVAPPAAPGSAVSG